MPTYEYLCRNGHEYEEVLPIAEFKKQTYCPTCKSKGKKRFTFRQSEPSFTDKLYPYWDKALNKVFNSPTDRKRYLDSKGLTEKPSKGSMTRKQEQEMYKMRLGNHDPRDRRYAE